MGCICCKDNELYNSTIDNTIKFVVPEGWCRVLSVYDGDTIIVSFRLGKKIYRHRLRLRGINAPEMRGVDHEEKNRGYQSRDYLKGLIEGKVVKLVNPDWDKYGRILADIHYGNIDVSKDMISKGYAVFYNGRGEKRS